MWIFAAVILISVGGSLGDLEVECYNKLQEECNTAENESPDMFPITAEELEPFCNKIKNYGNCAVEFVTENCEYDEIGVRQLKKEIAFIQDSCNPDSRIYQEISNSIECVIPIVRIEAQLCNSNAISNEVMKFVTSYKDSLLERGFQESKVEHCMKFMYEITCTASKVGEKCGSGAKEALLELAGNLAFEAATCEAYIEELPAFMESLELLQKGEEILKSFEKKK